MSHDWNDVRVVVTGGSGFIGTNLVEVLARCGGKVLNLDLKPPMNTRHGVHWQPLDILDRDALLRALRQWRPEIVFHLAARTDLGGTTVDDYRANTDGVRHMLEALASVPGLRRSIFASSRLVCKIGYQPTGETDYCPGTAYGESKVMGENLVREAAGMPWVMVRPTSIWGPWFGVPYRDFFLAVAHRRYFHPQGRAILKSYGYVENTVEQLVALSRSNASRVPGGTFYLADAPLNLKDWAAEIARQTGVGVRSAPRLLLRLGGLAGNLLQAMGVPDPPLTSFRYHNLVTTMIHDIAWQQALCPAPPIDLATGVSRTLAWMKEQRLL